MDAATSPSRPGHSANPAEQTPARERPRAASQAPPQPARILLVESDPIVLDSLGGFLRSEGHDVTAAVAAPEAIGCMTTGAFDLAIVDVGLPDRDGFVFLANVRENHPRTAVIMVTAYGSMESAVEALKLGAYEYLTKPIIEDDVRLAVERALQHQQLAEENQRLRRALGERPDLPKVISQDYRMAKVFELTEAVAAARTTVLICGESGTGKSLLARAIHAHSPRRGGPLVEVSCGAVAETLLESELFGHVRGAFTGALADKEGKFAAAEGGTIFLDEISSASPQLQLKLLRVLQDRRLEPVGSNRTREVDVRVLLATNRDLSADVKAGRFREDLYYRINVVSIELPPLRERAGDIPLLAKHFLEKYLVGTNKTTLGFSPEAMEAMHRYRWPGNVRELENCVERAVVLSRGIRIGLEDLPLAVRDGAASGVAGRTQAEVRTLAEALIQPQRQIILAALKANHGNRKAAARQLGINRATLYKKMAKLRITD